MKPISILYLEDSPVDAELALSLLKAAGIQHTVRRVETEEDFLAALQEGSEDLILADYVLPQFDGMTALEYARQHRPETPFVFVSGAIGEELAIDSLHHGATDYVLKQRLQRLVPAVRRALTEAEERRARKQAEHERRELLAREQAARAEAEARARDLALIIRDLEQFGYAVSHDLQEPLRMVKTYAQLLCRRYRDTVDGEGLVFIEYIEQGISHMERLISDLLVYSRHVHDRGTDLQLIDLETVVSDVLAYFGPQLEEAGAVVTVEPLPTVLADATRITSVFKNLISNSLKYRSTQPPNIYISAKQEGGAWVLSVRDNGIGFSPEYGDQIFGLFKRLHRDKYPGTGVGLALVKQIIEQHGGKTWAESAPGAGATFSFTLPAAGALTCSRQ
jgi:signal transduction histidine kinase